MMLRPVCPQCKRLAVFVNSHADEGVRVRSYGCKRCGEWSLGTEVGPADAKRTRAVISNIIRNYSGRFATSR
jgi:transposase-like protein